MTLAILERLGVRRIARGWRWRAPGAKRSTFMSAWLFVAIVGFGNPFVEAADVELSPPDSAPITALALSRDGDSLLLGSAAGVRIVSTVDRQVVSSLAIEMGKVHDMRFSPDGETLLVAGGEPAEGGKVEIWDWPRRQRIDQVTGHADVVYRVAWSESGDRFATAGGDGICQVFRIDDVRSPVRYAGHSRAVLAIGFVDQETIASAGVDQTVRLWKAADGSHLRTLDNHLDTINDLATGPQGGGRLIDGASDSFSGPKMLATIGEDRTVRLWQPSIGRLVRFRRLPVVPRAVAWSADGRRLYVGCQDGQIRTFDPDDLTESSETAGQVGRVHELIVDGEKGLVWIGGENGFHAVKQSE